MEIMKEFWEAKGNASLGLSAQNLRDNAAHFRKTHEIGQEINEAVEIHDHSQQEINICQGICINEDQNNRNPCQFMEDVMPCNLQWGRINGEVFSQQITRSYEEIVKWKRNFFLVPSGKVGK